MTKLGLITSTPEIKNMTSRELWAWAVYEAMQDANVTPRDVEAFYIGNMIGLLTERQYHFSNLLALWSGLIGKAGVTVEGACASSSHAIREAIFAIASGAYDIVIAGGVEILNATANLKHPGQVEELSSEQRLRNIYCHYDRAWEVPQMIMQDAYLSQWMIAYAKRYGLSIEDVYDTLDAVVMANYYNGHLNPKAYWTRTIEDVAREAGFETPKEFLRSSVHNPFIWWPIRLWHIHRLCDGAAAVVLCAMEKAEEFHNKPIKVLGTSSAQGAPINEKMYTHPFIVNTAKQAYEMAGIKPDEVDIVEVYDANAAEYVVSLEDIGYFERGETWSAIIEGRTRFTGDKPVNTSGAGSTGRAIGVVGAHQTYEIVKQLRGEAGARQVSPKPEIGLMFDAGAARNAVINIYGV